MKLNTLLVTFLAISFIACNNEKDSVSPIDENNLLLGYWSYRDFDENTTTFQRVGSLPDDEYGLFFKQQGVFIERKNPGWCGTPPVVLENFDGSWILKDDLLKIEVDDWMGSAEYTWKIIELNKHELSIEVVTSNYINPDN